MSIKIHANRVLGTIHVTQIFLGVFQGAQIKSGPKAPTDVNAALVLSHKTRQYNRPANFWPITLENVPLNIFTSCIRDSLFSFVSANKYVEKNQICALPKLTGKFEHTAQMANIISTARIKQRSVVITLLELKNVFL